MKLDLINSRSDPPPAVRIYDSLEDVHSLVRRSSKSLVRMEPVQVEIRAGDSKRIIAFGLDRFSDAIVDNKGEKVSIRDRYPEKKRKKHTKKLPVINFEPKADTDTQPTLSPSFLDNDKRHIENFNIEASFRCYALDMIKDKVHDHYEETVAQRVASKTLPGAWSKAQRGLMDEIEASDIGPGSYQITNVTAPSVPAITISKAERQKEEPSADLLPLEKRLRLERMKAYDELRSPSREKYASYADDSFPQSSSVSFSIGGPSFVAETGKIANLSGAPSSSTTSFSKRNTTFSSAPRFSELESQVECYIKTTGLLLGPDYDSNFDKRISFDMSKSQLSSSGRSRSPSPVHDVQVNIDKYFSVQSEVASSPRKYAACFRSKDNAGLHVIPSTTDPNIGPGSYPSAYPPTLEVRDPHKLSLGFRRGPRGLEVRKALPDGYDDSKTFAERHTKGPLFPLSASPYRKNHLAEVAERKLSQIYPKLIQKTKGDGVKEDGSAASLKINFSPSPVKSANMKDKRNDHGMVLTDIRSVFTSRSAGLHPRSSR
eukprot:gene4864-5332_t